LAVNGVEKLVKDNLSFLNPQDFKGLVRYANRSFKSIREVKSHFFYHQLITALNHNLNKSF